MTKLIEFYEAKWSQDVDMKWDVPEGFFKRSAISMAKGLKKASKSLKQAMSRLNFYINRAGDSLSAEDKKRLENAKDELRKLYGKQESSHKVEKYIKSKVFQPPMDLGGGYYLHKVGLDANGSKSIWVSRKDHRTMKFNTKDKDLYFMFNIVIDDVEHHLSKPEFRNKLATAISRRMSRREYRISLADFEEAKLIKSVVPKLREIVSSGSYGKVLDPVSKKRYLVDIVSAGMVVAVYDRVSDEIRAKMDILPLPSLISMAFNMYNKGSENKQ